MCKAEDLQQQAGWDGAEGTSRTLLLSELSKSISPSTMIPEHRLAILLHETKQGWIQNCLYHNTAESPSLYLDHLCDRSNFPSSCARTLLDHDDEVWFLTFSNNGRYLATAGKDKYVYIYDVDNDFKKVHILAEHQSGVCHISWSPDDTKLITCSREPDCMARIWNTSTGNCVAEISHFQHAVSGATWAPDSKTLIVGSQDWHNSLSSYRLPTSESSEEECELVYTWSKDMKMRIYDVALSPDGKRLVALLDSCILVYDFTTRELVNEYSFDKVKMTSVKISADSKHMLVSMNENKIRLMVMDTGETLQTFDGHKQANYMIRSVFGGADESFVVSGSEGESDVICCILICADHLRRFADIHLAHNRPLR
jgi:WD40 repeat protein